MKRLCLMFLLLVQVLMGGEPKPVSESEVLLVRKFVDELSRTLRDGNHEKARDVIHKENRDFYSDEAAVKAVFSDGWKSQTGLKLRKVEYCTEKDDASPPGVNLGKFPQMPKYLIEVDGEKSAHLYYLATTAEGLKLVFRKGTSK